jgi:hypothetical protein
MPENAYSDKNIKKIATIKDTEGEIEYIDDLEPAGNNALIVRADGYGTGADKVLISKMPDGSGVFWVQTAFIPRFNHINSVYPFSLIANRPTGSYDHTGLANILRVGEKQTFDTFLNCVDNVSGTFPLSKLGKISRGASIKKFFGYDYRQLYYHIEAYLESLPILDFGNTPHTGGSDVGYPLVSKSTFDLKKETSELVYSLNEGVHITSGFYRNEASGIPSSSFPVDQNTFYRDQFLIPSWVNGIEKLKSSKIAPGNTAGGSMEHYTLFPIYENYKGWISFWIEPVMDGQYMTQRFKHRLIHRTSIDTGYEIVFDSIALQDSGFNDIFSDVDWSKPHRVTYTWNYLEGRSITVQLDDFGPYTDTDPVDATHQSLLFFIGRSLVGFGFGGNYNIYGLVQGGDWFPFVYPESNKGYYTPFNLNLLEGVNGIIGPNRRDSGFKNQYTTQDEDEDFESYTVDDVIYTISGSWNGAGDNGTDLIARVAELDELDLGGKVLKILDQNNAGFVSVYYDITQTDVGCLYVRLYPIQSGNLNEYLFLDFNEGATQVVSIRINMNTGDVFIWDPNAGPAAYVDTTYNVTFTAVNCMAIELSTNDEDSDGNSPDCRCWVNHDDSSWMQIANPIVVGVDRFYIYTVAADNDVTCYLDDITWIIDGNFFASGKEPRLSFPEGEFLNFQYLQKGVGSCRVPHVRITDDNGDGIEKRLRSASNTNSQVDNYLPIGDHYVDDVIDNIPQIEQNYRFDRSGIVSYIDGQFPNWWLPLGILNQVHPKYNKVPYQVFVNDAWYERFVYAMSAGSYLFRKPEKIVTSNEEYENIAELEYTPMTHPFCKPVNIGHFYSDNNAIPEKFCKSPQWMRKNINIIEERFGDYGEGDSIVSGSIYWTNVVATSTTYSFTCEKDNNDKIGHLVEASADGNYQVAFRFPYSSPNIPGSYNVTFDVKQLSNNTLNITLRDNVPNVPIQIRFNSGTGNVECLDNAVWRAANAWVVNDKYEIDVVIVDSSNWHIIINGVKYDNAGTDFVTAGAAAWANPIYDITFANATNNNVSAYIDDINCKWNVYPNVDTDDFIVYPSHLGHARPIEVVTLDDPWYFNNHSKYTVIPKTHPTRFWVSLFVTAQGGELESESEIVFYDVSGSEMFYLSLVPQGNSEADYSKKFEYASDSAETTTSLTNPFTGVHSGFIGWLPVTVEIDSVNSIANLYYQDTLIASGIALNAGLEAFGWISVIAGYKTLPARGNGSWRDDDFQGYTQGADITVASVDWAGTAGVFVAWDTNGDVSGRYTPGAAGNSEVFTFPTASPAFPGNYGVRWEFLNTTQVACDFYIGDAAANNRIQIRLNAATGDIESDSGAGFVATGATWMINEIPEITIITDGTVNNHYVIVDGVQYGPIANFAAFTGPITRWTITNMAAGGVIEIDNLDASWTKGTNPSYEDTGSIMIDGIQWSCGDGDSYKNFVDRNQYSLVDPYRDYVNTHRSTFYNVLNGPDEDIITLPPWYGSPLPAHNHASWTRGNYWDFYSSEITGMYAGLIHNWYIWNFPYVFGGSFYRLDGEIFDLYLKSVMRLYHDVGVSERQTSGKWEFLLGATFRDNIYEENWEEYPAGYDIVDNPANGWIARAGALTTITVANVGGSNRMALFDNSGVNRAEVWKQLRGMRKGAIRFTFRSTNTALFQYLLMFDQYSSINTIPNVNNPITNQGINISFGGGTIQCYDTILAVYVNTAKAISADTDYDVIIFFDLDQGGYHIVVDGTKYTRAGSDYDFRVSLAYSDIEFNFLEFVTHPASGGYTFYVDDIEILGSNGEFEVTLDFDKLVDDVGADIDEPWMDPYMGYKLKYIPDPCGTKLYIHGDGVVESFQRFEDGESIIVAGQWVNVTTPASTTFEGKLINGSIWGNIVDGNGAAAAFARYAFVNPRTIQFGDSIKWKDYCTSATEFHEYQIEDTGPVARIFITIQNGNVVNSRPSAVDQTIATGIFAASSEFEFQIVFIDSSQFDIIINGAFYDNSGNHFDTDTAFVTGIYYFVPYSGVASQPNFAFDNIAASWERDENIIGNLCCSKELHHVTVEWKKGYIWTYIEDTLVDSRIYAGGNDFYLDKFKFHCCAREHLFGYGVLFGAQCSNEAGYKEGCLKAYPGGTLEQEGATGHLINRNQGAFFLENNKDDWSWEKKHHWKTLVLDPSTSRPDMSSPREQQTSTIEYGKDVGGDWYTQDVNRLNVNYLIHTAQVGPPNTDLETYGKFFSMFVNDFTGSRLNTILRLYDMYTFTHGYTTGRFSYTILGLDGSFPKLLAPYAIQLSQIRDLNREITKSVLVDNMEGYVLYNYYKRLYPYADLFETDDSSKIRFICEILSKKDYPTLDNLRDVLSIIMNVDENYVEVVESGDSASVYIPNLLTGTGVFNRARWFQDFLDFISLFKAAGVEYTTDTFSARVTIFIKSDNASGVYTGGDQVEW